MSLQTINLGKLKQSMYAFLFNYRNDNLKIQITYNNYRQALYGYVLDNINDIDGKIIINIIPFELKDKSNNNIVESLKEFQKLIMDYTNNKLPVLLYDIDKKEYFAIKDMSPNKTDVDAVLNLIIDYDIKL